MKPELHDLESVEDFFEFYQIPYNSTIVLSRRFHILKRFREYLQQEQLLDGDSTNSQVWQKQRSFLMQSYQEAIHFSPQQREQKNGTMKRTSGCSGCKGKCF